MVKKECRSDVANLQVAYALNPINSFGEYIDEVGNIFNIAHEIRRKEGYPVLISPNGECVSDMSMLNHEMKFVNSELLKYDSVAKRIAEEKGYLFFPSGKMDKDIFSRSFAYKDFVEGARRIVQNIDPSLTCNGEPYVDFVKKQRDKLEQNLKYLDSASLKWDTSFGGGNLHIIGDLDAEHIGGIKSYSSNGFNGASLVVKIGHDSNYGKVVGDTKLKAQFHPGFLDSSFSEEDFNNINSAVRNISGCSEQDSLDRVDMGFEDSFLNFDYYLWNSNNSNPVFTASEMMGTFSKYIHLIHNGIKGVVKIKRDKRKDKIFALEEMIKNSELDK